jgi:hypothetical protein
MRWLRRANRRPLGIEGTGQLPEHVGPGLLYFADDGDTGFAEKETTESMIPGRGVIPRLAKRTTRRTRRMRMYWRRRAANGEDPMQPKDDDIWAIAIGMDSFGIERNFPNYANRRGFTVRSRTKGSHSTLKQLTESNVRKQIAFVHRIRIDRFQHRPRNLHPMEANIRPAHTKQTWAQGRLDRWTKIDAVSIRSTRLGVIQCSNSHFPGCR